MKLSWVIQNVGLALAVGKMCTTRDFVNSAQIRNVDRPPFDVGKLGKGGSRADDPMIHRRKSYPWFERLNQKSTEGQ